MLKLLAIVLLSVSAFAQTATLPTLPAVNTVANASLTCSIESQDDQGGLFVQCQNPTDATVQLTATLELSAFGDVFAHDSLACVYWQESAGKNRLQCSDGKKVVLDGYVPSVTKKRRWYLFYR